METATIITKIPEKIIPAHTIKEITYIAYDGREFSDRLACVEYENYLYHRKMEIDTKVTDIDLPEVYEWFYAHNEEQLEWIKDKLTDINPSYNELTVYGNFHINEWYGRKYCVDSDYPQSIDIYSLTEFKKKVLEELDKLIYKEG